MKKMLYVAWNALLLLRKDRMAVVWMVLLPLGLTFIAGLVFGGLGEGDETTVIDLPVVDLDGGELATAVINTFLEAENLRVETKYDEQKARQLVADGKRVGAVIIPAGFSDAVSSGHPTELELIIIPANQTAPLLAGMVRGVTSNIAGIQTTVNVTIAELQQVARDLNLDYDEVAERVTSIAVEQLKNPLVTAHVTTVGQSESEDVEFDIFEQVVPGYAVMFAMFAVMSAAGAILEEKEQGTFKRLVISPITSWSLLGGKLLAQFLIGVGQVALMFVFGAFVFGVNLGDSLLGLALITLATCWATTSLGILLIAVIRSHQQAHAISTLVILGFSALGGAWFPFFWMPKAVQMVARITLVAWAMEGYNRLIILDKGLSAVWVNIGALVIYGAICFAIGVKLFRFRET